MIGAWISGMAGKPTTGSASVVAVTFLVYAVGLLLVVVGDALSRLAFGLSDAVFWLGIGAMVLWSGRILIGREASRSERVAVVTMLGGALYLVKLFHSPNQFTFHDEILHVRTIGDIATSGRLFERNPLLLVSPLYPGLEIVTNVVAGITGGDVFLAGVVVAGSARLVLMGALFFLFEHASGDSRLAGIGVLAYAANPNFLLFDAQFSYETLALTLAVVALVLTAAGISSSRLGLLTTIVVIGATIATHHITAYVLIGILGIWAAVQLIPGWRRKADGTPLSSLAITIVGVLVWIGLVASETLLYLGPRVVDALEFFRFLIGQSAARPLFTSSAGDVAPVVERLVGVAGVLLILVALPIGLWHGFRHLRDHPLAVTLGIIASTYPATLALRLTARGSEESSRTPEFVFLGVAFVVALAVGAPLRLPSAALASVRQRLRGRIAVPVLTVIFVGGVIIGTPRWARLPGPYLPSADTRSIEAEGVAAAKWSLQHLGTSNRVVTDRINRILMGAYGRQTPVTEFADQIKTWSLFYTSTFSPTDRAILRAGRIDYLIVDLRLPSVRPLTRVYFENGEPGKVAAAGGLTYDGLTKFEHVPGVDIVFDSGNLRIYDVRAISGDAGPSS